MCSLHVILRGKIQIEIQLHMIFNLILIHAIKSSKILMKLFLHPQLKDDKLTTNGF